MRLGKMERLTAAGRDGFASGYGALMRGARRLAQSSGVLDALDRRRDSDRFLFLRSLFAVHDVKDLARLDLPWWTMNAVRHIEGLMWARQGRVRAFEYGGGASTLWLARRCHSVTTVEHDPEWWPVLSEQLDGVANVTARHVPATPDRAPSQTSWRAGWRDRDFGPYVKAIRNAEGPFDLVVIDGRARAACLMEARLHLAPNGVIIFDNSNRRRYATAIRQCGLTVERFRGFAPSVPWPSETALLARDSALLRAP